MIRIYNSSHFYVGNNTASFLNSRFGLVSACGGAEGGGGVFVDRSVNSPEGEIVSRLVYFFFPTHTHEKQILLFWPTVFMNGNFQLRGKSTFRSLYI